ncbi:MAG: serine hydrolase [Candidatus Sulfotelmatobacter sp.]|jgi:CubicO group peptidase (beta-lactamase class C family)
MRAKQIGISQCAKNLALTLILFSIATGIAKPQVNHQQSEDARIERVLSGLRPPVAIKGQPPDRWALAEGMAQSHVPGISIAVIDNGQIAWARGFGVIEAGRTDPVTTSTLFEAQSISKAVTATATLVLINSRRLSLDKSPNVYLKSWKVPYNEYQAQEKVTLRRILSHCSGLTVGGFAGYRVGEPLPSLLQILNGEKPANNPPIRVDFVPGSRFRYSGGGAEVMQQLLIDVTGQPFPELMKRLVLTPVGMTSSTYEQPLPQARWAHAASGHDGEGDIVKGKWPIQPEMAAGGLWTTPTDLAKWALAITRALTGDQNDLFSKRIATEMLTVQKAPYGLGVEVQGTGPSLEFSHGGSNFGFRAQVVMFPAVGKGAVIMANGDRADWVISSLIKSIASEYDWPALKQTEREVVPLSTAQLDALLAIYSLPPGPSGEPVTYEITRTGNRLFAELKGLGSYPRYELFPSSATSFFSTSGLNVDFTLDASGRATGLKMGEIPGTRK